MRLVQNLPHLNQPSGEPIPIPKGDDGKPISGAAITLADWIVVLLNNLPRERYPFADWVKATAIIGACSRAEKSGVIELDDDHAKWLEKVSFDDEEGKRIIPKQKLGPDEHTMITVEIDCCYAVWLVGPFTAVAIQRGLTQLQPATPAAAESNHAAAPTAVPAI